jgi:hypothetical protein
LLLALASATFAIACASTINVHSIVLLSPDSAQYQTFSFGARAPEGVPDNYQASPRTEEVQRRAQLLVAGLLQERGYVQKPYGGDFVVRIASGRRAREELRAVPIPHPEPTGPAWFEEHEEEDFVEGILVIDVFDGKSQQALWHGAARVEIDSDKIDDQLLRRATSKVLAAFPWSRAGRRTP